jgi:hypothetical protein
MAGRITTMKHVLCILTLLVGLAVLPCSSEQEITKAANPKEVTKEMVNFREVPKEIEGLQWNRWTSKNFTVVALNDKQAQYLHKHLELVKGWCFARWGMYDIDFSTECKVIGVDNPALFKKLFNLDTTKVEIRRDEKGKIKESVIFLLMNGSPSQTIPAPLTEVCMEEFAQKYNTKFGVWNKRGMMQLNGTIPQIRDKIAEIKPLLDKNEPLFFTRGLMEMDQDSHTKLDEGKKRIFDNCAMMYCLMIRKEFGQDNYLRVMKMASESKPEEAVQKHLKFANYGAIDRTFKRYMIDLTIGVASGKTPDHYLQIREK